MKTVVPGAKEDSEHPNILSYNDDDSSDEENPEDCLLEQGMRGWLNN